MPRQLKQQRLHGKQLAVLRMFSFVPLLIIAISFCWAQEPLRIGFIGEPRDRPPALSNLDEYPEDEGLAGALLGIEDNNTSGRFTGQLFELEQRNLAMDEDPVTALAELVAQRVEIVVVDLTSESLGQILDSQPAKDVLLLNTASQDRDYRNDACQPNLLHTALSHDMRTDALAQFLVGKRWTEWFLVSGTRAEDQRFSEAITRSARKFGAKIVAQKTWDGQFDARRLARSEVTLFTQGEEYDVLIVSDTISDFGNYLMYQTADPRPVAGTQGLTPKAWGRPLEQWGAAQLQERFLAQSGRWMRSRDYAAWLAVRAIGEAALRTSASGRAELEQYMRSDDFQLAGFKGRKMSFRNWNGQLRQPVPLMWPGALVAQAPIEGFLHQRTELDTLGLDKGESLCKLP